MKKILRSISAVLVLGLIFFSCKLDNGTSNPQTGFFMVANVSPDAPHLNVNVNNSAFDTGLVFGSYTPYVSANAGTYNFAFYPSGSSTPVLTNNVTIDVNKVYSYFVIDSFSKVKSAVVEDVFKAPSGDSVYVRFFNFCPNLTQAIDVKDSANNTSLFSSRTFNDQASNPSFAAFNEIKAGAYTLQLKQIDGTLLSSQSTTLEGGKVYTLFAQGFKGGIGDQALSIGQIINFAQ